MAEKEKNNLIPRPPIVVVMGHIDHGKTTLLDFIRKTKITEKEVGGITQHVGAYEVKIKDKTGKERLITFLDTPGHEAFSKIRARGAKTADVAVLVVAAEEGVKPQTEEALAAIKEAGLPFVIAVNKIDKESANPDKVKKEFSEKGAFVEEWGGNIPCVNISAKTGQNIEELLELILILGDLEELKTNPDESASGVILESHIDGKRGLTATLLIQNGRLKQGMFVASKTSISPVRIFEDFLGKSIKEASASSPVRIVGFNGLPEAGAEFRAYDSRKEAEAAARKYLTQMEEKAVKHANPEIPEVEGLPAGRQEKLLIPIVIKSDVIGSKEALEKELEKLSGGDEEQKVAFNLLRSAIGDINEDDIKLASSGKKSVILGFNVKCPESMKLLAERLDVSVQIFDIIYKMEDWLKEEMEKRKPLEQKEEVIGKIRIIKLFGAEKNKKNVGGEIISGKAMTDRYVKIFRRDFLLGDGHMMEMRKFQTTIREAGEGEQIGLLIQTKTDIALNDTLEIIEKN